MYKILIADDEPSVIHSLRTSIAWEDYNLEIGGIASNGAEALAIIRQTHIDIAILDIRMPGLNGLELCEVLHQQDSHIQTIIISGYAEFSYAQKAIQYGVLGYCLKPIDYTQLISILMRAIFHLQSQSPLKSQDTFLEALENDQSASLKSALAQLGFTNENFYVAASLGSITLSPLAEEGIACKTGHNQYCYLYTHQLREKEMLPFRQGKSGQCLGIYPEPVPITGLHFAVDSCYHMAHQFFIEPDLRLCLTPDTMKASEYLGRLTHTVAFADKTRIVNVLQSALEIDYKKIFTIRSALQLCNILFSSSLFQYEENDYYIYGLKQLISEYGTFSGMIHNLIQTVETLDSRMIPLPAPTNNTAFFKVLRFINDYYRQDISLAQTAEQLHMNPNYISQMFKKETGITFIRYITDLRVEHAKKLLSTTSMSISDIASEAGFNDYFYFLKTFKKITGITPSQFRLTDR